jgi:hypothetical protein
LNNTIATLPFGAAQIDQPANPRGERRGAFVAAAHLPRAGDAFGAAAEHRRRDRPVQFGQRDHHRCLDRGQPGGGFRP